MNQRPKILVVDDLATNRLAIRMALRGIDGTFVGLARSVRPWELGRERLPVLPVTCSAGTLCAVAPAPIPGVDFRPSAANTDRTNSLLLRRPS